MINTYMLNYDSFIHSIFTFHPSIDINPKTRFTAEQALNHPWVTGRTVQPNNYLQSPSLLGDTKKRQELRQEMNKSPVMNPGRHHSGAGVGGLDTIKEDRHRSGICVY